jgi:hypothetical protein
MPRIITREQIREAFRILFGSQITFSDAVLNYLQPSGIKSAFREQVKRKHPDTADLTVRTPVEISEEFHSLYEAYRLLMDLKSHRFRRMERKEQVSPLNKPVAEPGDFFYQGRTVPVHHLRLGEFLFYSKVISWHTLIQAIVYKKQFDDKLMGRYFIEKRILDEADLHRYLSLQRAHNGKIAPRT